MEDPRTVVATTKSPTSTTTTNTDKEDPIDTENVEKTVSTTDELPDSPISNSTNRPNKPKKLDLNKTKANQSNNNNHKLSSNQLENIAIQIVSPGLPPLSSKMSKMVLKSKSIAQQQKKLIAQRNGVDINEIEKQEILMTNNQQQQQSVTSQSSKDNNLPKNNNDDDHDLVIPSPKKLKREKLPTPLNIANHSRIPNPLIRSAPAIRSNRRKPILRYHNLRHQGVPYNPYLAQQQQQLPPQQQQIYYPNTYYPYYYPPPPQLQQQQQMPILPQQQQQQAIPYGYRPIQTSIAPHPVSTNRVHFLNRNGGHSTTPSSATTSATSSSTSSTLTGAAAAAAAITTTTPSSSTGNNPVIDVYPTGVMKEAPIIAQPLSAQHARFVDRERQIKQEAKDDEVMAESDVESIAIEDTAEIDANSSFMEISGEIRLNDDLFHYNLGTTSDLQKDRERFLKICSTAWDEFTKML